MLLSWFGHWLVASVLVACAAKAWERVPAGKPMGRRRVWFAALLAIMALGLVTLLWPGGVDRVAGGVLPGLDARAVGAGSGEWLDSASGALLWLWIGSSCVLLGLFVWAHLRIRAIVRSCRPSVVAQREVLVSAHFGPAALGVVQPCIVLPEWVLTLGTEQAEMIVAHEEEHIQGGDTRMLAAAALLVTLTPFNPVIWWLNRRVHEAVETDCDARLLNRGLDVRQYGELLLETVARGAHVPRLSPAFVRLRPLLEKRIFELTRPTGHPRVAVRVLLATAGLVAFIAACDVVEPDVVTAAEADLRADAVFERRAGTISARPRAGGTTVYRAAPRIGEGPAAASDEGAESTRRPAGTYRVHQIGGVMRRIEPEPK